jgi:hypothetical protein
MKKFFLLFLLMIVLAGCGKEGPVGPAGPTGPQGSPGRAGGVQSYVLSVQPTNKNQATRFQLTAIQSYSTPSGGQYVSSVVNVYAKIAKINVSDWLDLPVSFIEDDGSISNVYFSVAPGEVIVNTVNASRPTSQFMVYITVVN